MMFTFVYSGWEGSAHDAKVLMDALTNSNANFPWPPRGKHSGLLYFENIIFFNDEINI